MEAQGGLIAIAATDPLHLTGTITAGERVSRLASNRILYRDGVKYLQEVRPEVQWETRTHC